MRYHLNPSALLLLGAGAVVATGGCKARAERGDGAPAAATASPAGTPETRGASNAVAELLPTQGQQVKGRVEFHTRDGGVTVKGTIEGLAPGEHGFHIHEKGDCSAPDASSAGGHFDPGAMPHAGPDAPRHHAGDLGNVTAGPSGRAEIERTQADLILQGPGSIIGRSVVVHAGRDDLTSQPSGNSGARVACGVIRAQDSD